MPQISTKKEKRMITYMGV